MSANCSIFWDHSNLYSGARRLAAARESASVVGDVRIHYESLFELAHAHRPVSKAVCVTSSNTLDVTGVTGSLSSIGLQVELYERGARTHGEQAVDQALQVHMLRALADQPPGVAVLLTGDGAGYDRGAGFLADLERMHRGGWAVEVLAWRDNCNRHLRKWAAKHGLYIPLDDFYQNVTFVKELRRQKPFPRPPRRVVEMPAGQDAVVDRCT
jgi:NYN domain